VYGATMKQALAVALFVILVPAGVHADTSAAQAERSVVLTEQIATIVDANKDNCDAMGDKLGVFLDKNGKEIDQLRAAGKTLTAEQKKAFEDKYAERMKAAGAKIMPGLQKCGSNAKVSSVMKKATGR
jgi:hypothetical protein